MNSDIYRDVLNEYERLKTVRERELTEREIEVEEKIPEYFDLENKIKLLASEEAIARIKNPEGGNEEFSKELAALERKKEKLLTSHGYDKDYLSYKYQCDICKDTGYIGEERCQCFNKKLTERLFARSGISYLVERENFSTFNIEVFSKDVLPGEGISPRENMETILKFAKRFISTFEEQNDMNLLFYGKPGLGKTFLLNCIAKDLMEKNVQVMYITAYDMLRTLEELKFSKEKTADLIYARDLLYNAELLIVDDLGIEVPNSFTNSEIFNLINSRIIRGKKTLISTNLNQKELSDTYTDRVFSRVYQKFTILKFIGDDLRIRL